MSKGTLIVLMSPAGGAKSVIANYLEKTKPNCVTVSRRQMERASGRFDEMGTWSSFKKFHDKLNEYLLTFDYVIANDYNVFYDDRKLLFDNITNASRIIGIWIEVPEKIALEHNKEKEFADRVELSFIKSTFKYAESPREEELFDDLIFISKDTLSSGMGTSKSNPAIQDMYELLDQI